MAGNGRGCRSKCLNDSFSCGYLLAQATQPHSHDLSLLMCSALRQHCLGEAAAAASIVWGLAVVVSAVNRLLPATD